MFSWLLPPAGFEGGQPKLGREMRQWGEDGLIPEAHSEDMAEDVIVNMLRVIREHINESSRT